METIRPVVTVVRVPAILGNTLLSIASNCRLRGFFGIFGCNTLLKLPFIGSAVGDIGLRCNSGCKGTGASLCRCWLSQLIARCKINTVESPIPAGYGKK